MRRAKVSAPTEMTWALWAADQLRNHDVAVLVRMEEDTGLSSLLECKDACHPLVQRVTSFGQINRASALERLQSNRQDYIARHIHENYLPTGRADPNKQTDDEVLREWDKLPESYKNANRQVADHVDVKLRAVGLPAGKTPARVFTTDEIEILSRM